MKLSVTTETDIYPIEVEDELELENFMALCEVEVSWYWGSIVFLAFKANKFT